MRPLKLILWIGLLFLAGYIYSGLRHRFIARPPAVQDSWKAQAARVRILRDEWGVAHVFGKTAPDTAFGIAYAHAQDDYPTIQGALAAARGRSSLLQLSLKNVLNDYYAGLFDIRAETEASYGSISPDVRAVIEGYAEGLNYYASLHPSEADGRLLPVTGKDVAAGFLHKLPLFEGMLQQVLPLYGRKFDPKQIVTSPSASVQELALASGGMTGGSNSHAVHASRSTDGITRLNVNSHQPWTGDVAWYEIQAVSEDGWNMTGGLFPGSPFPLVGHNDHLGWAHTVNRPDLVDVYELTMNGDDYVVDGQTVKFEKHEVELQIDLGLFTATVHRTAERSIYGPVFRSGEKAYSVRYAGMGRVIRSVEQWYKMGRARNFREWKQAMEIQALPMFNTVYADASTIYYVYNALLPERAAGYDWDGIVPGNTRRTLWTGYLPYSKLPQVTNPPSGFVQSCNSSPFQTTKGSGNPQESAFKREYGISVRMTNRALRSLELLGEPGKISRERFLEIKWDRAYVRNAPIFTEAVNPVLASYKPRNEAERDAIENLRSWDGRTNEGSQGAMLAILTWTPIWFEHEVGFSKEIPSTDTTFREAVEYLQKHYGTTRVPLGQVQRLRRGNLDLPLGGGADIMNAVYTVEDDAVRKGWAGDSYIMIAEFSRDGARSSTLHQFGNSSRPESPHFADQAPLFVKRILRPSLRTEAEIKTRLESEYHPGAE